MKGYGPRRRPAGTPDPPEIRNICASFQQAAVDMLVERLMRAARDAGASRLAVVGGVACNGRLREEFGRAAQENGIALFLPTPRYTTDNAAMIAAAGFLHLERGQLAPAGLTARAELPL